MPPVPEESSFDDEDLIEIEKVDMTYPEFSAAETAEETGTQESVMTSETPTDQDLPLWKPVTETTTKDFTFTEKTPTAEEIPEFTPSKPQPLREETPEKPAAWTPAAEGEEPQGPPQQTREQKKAERQRQKEEKRQRKLEQKKERKEGKQREKEAKRRRELEEQKALMQAKEEPEASPFTPALEETPPAPEEPSEEPVEQPPAIKVDISAFKGIESIDDHTGELLYRNGYFSLDDVRKATVDDLVQIRGIKRKLAKTIKKEVEQKTTPKTDEEFVSISKKPSAKKPKKQPEDVTEWETFSVNNHEDVFQPRGATYKEYTLYKKARGKGAEKTTVHFFSKEKPTSGTPVPLPIGYEIAVNKRTKIPYLKKKK